MKKIFATFVLLLIAILFEIFINIPKSVVAKDECPPPGVAGWTKIDSDDLTSYPVTGATQYCFKYGSSNNPNPNGCIEGISDEWPPLVDGNYCGLSHWAYYIPPVATPSPSPSPSLSPSPSPSISPSPSSGPSVSPSPTPSPSLTPSPSVSPSSSPTGSGSPTPTPIATLTPTPTTTIHCGEGEHLDASGKNCVRFSDPGVESPIGGTEITGQVLGASSMAGTGVAQDNLFAAIFTIGSVLASFGIRKFSVIK